MIIEQDASRHDSSTPEVVRQAQTGSIEAFTRLVNDYQRPIQRFLAMRCSDAEVVADLTQDTFVAVYEHLPQLKDSQAFEAWLYQIVRHCWYMYLRHRQSRTEISLADIVEWIHPPNELLSRQSEIQQIGERLLVRRALDTMRPKLRKAFWLRHVAGLSDREIAGVMHVSPAAAQKRAYRAEAAFRANYNKLTHPIEPSRNT